MAAERRLLIVDDSPEDRALYRRLIEQGASFHILEAELGEAGLALCRAERPDCVLLDYRLPDLDGLEILAALQDRDGQCAAPVVFLTGQGSERLVAEVMKAGAADYLPKKGLTSAALCRAVKNAIAQHQLRAAIHEHGRLIEERNAALARKNAEIQRFYHTLSHELKTPLTAAREFVAILLDGIAGPLNDTQREYLGIAKQSCDQMKRMLDDLLDAARLETGKLSLDLQPANIGEVAREVLAAFAPLAEEKGIRLRQSIAPGFPEVLIDRQRIAQVLTNLLNNALKFTEAGGEITARASPDPDPKWPHQVLIAVSDTGRGIAEEHLDAIFRRLYQVQESDMSTAGGMGLGLSLCRGIIRQHGGEIWVESQPGTGSTFFFTLPAWDPAKMTLLS